MAWLAANPVLCIVLGLMFLLVAAWIWQWIKTKSLESIIFTQEEVIKHQEKVIIGLEESLKNAEVKRKHEEVSKSISNDALRERMQHEGYYRD